MLRKFSNPCQYINDAALKICKEDPGSKLCKETHDKFAKCMDRHLQLATISKMCCQKYGMSDELYLHKTNG